MKRGDITWGGNPHGPKRNHATSCLNMRQNWFQWLICTSSWKQMLHKINLMHVLTARYKLSTIATKRPTTHDSSILVQCGGTGSRCGISRIRSTSFAPCLTRRWNIIDPSQKVENVKFHNFKGDLIVWFSQSFDISIQCNDNLIIVDFTSRSLSFILL